MLANASCQSLFLGLTHRFREQARSHLGYSLSEGNCRALRYAAGPTP
jgi:hypothetical protein